MPKKPCANPFRPSCTLGSTFSSMNPFTFLTAFCPSYTSIGDIGLTNSVAASAADLPTPNPFSIPVKKALPAATGGRTVFKTFPAPLTIGFFANPFKSSFKSSVNCSKDVIRSLGLSPNAEFSSGIPKLTSVGSFCLTCCLACSKYFEYPSVVVVILSIVSGLLILLKYVFSKFKPWLSAESKSALTKSFAPVLNLSGLPSAFVYDL